MEYTCKNCASLLDTSAPFPRTGFCPECGAPLAHEMSGYSVGDYVILAELGRGANGAVFLARQKALNREVALKLLPSEFAGKQNHVRSFFNEARSTARLCHANIVQAIDAGVSETGIYFFAMELVDGKSLETLIADFGAMKFSLVLTIASKIADAMDYAWETGRMIHGDIKPANIILNSAGEPKLADLGLAQFDGAGTFEMATPLYVSPEVVNGDPARIDFRADIYSFGAMLYEMFSGEPPFFDPDPGRVINMHLNDEPESLEKRLGFFDPGISNFINSMLAKNPADRPNSWHVVAGFLRRNDITAQLKEI